MNIPDVPVIATNLNGDRDARPLAKFVRTLPAMPAQELSQLWRDLQELGEQTPESRAAREGMTTAQHRGVYMLISYVRNEVVRRATTDGQP